METYRFYTPRMRCTQMANQELDPGDNDCQHQLADEAWTDRVSVQDGMLFVTYSCKHCGRVVCQSFDQVQPPATWNIGND
jgi:hypothetical protein